MADARAPAAPRRPLHGRPARAARPRPGAARIAAGDRALAPRPPAGAAAGLGAARRAAAAAEALRRGPRRVQPRRGLARVPAWAACPSAACAPPRATASCSWCAGSARTAARRAGCPGCPDGRWAPATARRAAGGRGAAADVLARLRRRRRTRAVAARRAVPTTSVESWPAPLPPPRAERRAERERARHTGEVRQLVESLRTLADARVYGGGADQLANARDAVDVWLIDARRPAQPLASRRVRGHGARPAADGAATGARAAAPGCPARGYDHARDPRRTRPGRAARRCSASRRDRARRSASRSPACTIGGGALNPDSLAGTLLTAPLALEPAPPPPASARQAEPQRPRQAEARPSGPRRASRPLRLPTAGVRDGPRAGRERADRAVPPGVVLRPRRTRARRAHRAADRDRRQGPAQAAQVGERRPSPTSSSGR